jgi:hypothetical protein
MNSTTKKTAFGLLIALVALGTAAAQETTTYTNRHGDHVTDTRTLQNGQYTNDRTVTMPNGETRTNDFTASRNGNGRLVSSDTHTGVNGRSVTKMTTHGFYGNRTTVTGPNGRSRSYYRRR